MKTIHIVEGIMSLVGKVGKAFNQLNKWSKHIKTQIASEAEIYKVERVTGDDLAVEGLAVEQATLKVEKDKHLHRKQQLKEEAIKQQLLEEAKEEVAVGAALLKGKSLRLEQRLQRTERCRLRDKNKGMIIPLHRRGAYQMQHKVSKTQGKVVYLHQREPTLASKSADSAHDREKGMGS